ncbi:MAG: gliding motility-associated C-terminal domain-containing protein [Cytophagales bacterium]|nr:gliding motility-associated C-terminal domain-containing protein [Cytophagales bacterium]
MGIGTHIFTMTVNSHNLCTDIYKKSFLIVAPTTLVVIDTIYNYVTMSKNGKNDYFEIKDIEKFPDNFLEIYDEWGQQAYAKQGYVND